MTHAEYHRLHREHERLKSAHRAALRLLLEIGFMATDEEYIGLKVAVEDARYDLEMVRRKLEQSESEKKTVGAGEWART